MEPLILHGGYLNDLLRATSSLLLIALALASWALFVAGASAIEDRKEKRLLIASITLSLAVGIVEIFLSSGWSSDSFLRRVFPWTPGLASLWMLLASKQRGGKDK